MLSWCSRTYWHRYGTRKAEDSAKFKDLFRLRPVTPDGLPALLAVKDDPALHRGRLRQQSAGAAVYLGAFTDGTPGEYEDWCIDMIKKL